MSGGDNSGKLWTKERDAQLVKLRDQGFSSAQIAVQLGVTGNAVIGRANRLKLVKLDRGPKTVRKRQSAVRRTPFKIPSVATKVSPYAAITADSKSDAPVTLFDLQPHHCRWPVRDAPYLFCGDAKQDGSSYCGRHFGVSRRGVANHW